MGLQNEIESLKTQLTDKRFEQLREQIEQEQSVIAIGEAGCIDSISKCKDAALNEAIRNAAEQGAAMIVESLTEVKDSVLVKDEMKSQVKAMVLGYEVLKRGWVSESSYQYKIKARVKGQMPSDRNDFKRLLYGDRFQATRQTKQGKLFVQTTPHNAVVRVMNIRPTFFQGIPLEPGPYQIEAAAEGYETYREWIELSAGEDRTVRINLAKIETDVIPGTSVSKTPLVYVPAGEFLMGGNDGDSDESPPHKVYLDAFFIEKYEVSATQYAAFLNAAVGNDMGTAKKYLDYTDDYDTVIYQNGRFRARPGYENHPANDISWYGADAYCRYIGRRLPTEAEWEKAARGTDGRKYPWGNNEPGRNHDLAVYDYDGHDDKWTDMKPVDSLPAEKSPYGAHHMAGNVWEWTADRYGGNYYSDELVRNPRGPNTGASRVIRGGSWSYFTISIRAADRNYATPDYRYNRHGCRCAQ